MTRMDITREISRVKINTTAQMPRITGRKYLEKRSARRCTFPPSPEACPLFLKMRAGRRRRGVCCQMCFSMVKSSSASPRSIIKETSAPSINSPVKIVPISASTTRIPVVTERVRQTVSSVS